MQFIINIKIKLFIYITIICILNDTYNINQTTTIHICYIHIIIETPVGASTYMCKSNPCLHVYNDNSKTNLYIKRQYNTQCVLSNLKYHPYFTC